MLDYLYTIAQTNALEIPVYFLFLRKRMSFWQCVAVISFANALTHPLFFFGFLGSHQSYFTSTLSGEVFAPALEACVLVFAVRVSWTRAIVASVAANLVSWQVAPILTYLIFFPASRSF